MNLKCTVSGHIWHTTKIEVDPMSVPGTFSNYVNTVYDALCVRCGSKERHIAPRKIPDDSQELSNRKARSLGTVFP